VSETKVHTQEYYLVLCTGNLLKRKSYKPERIEYEEAYDRLLFGSHETSPIIRLGNARTGDTVLVKSREMTGRTQTLSWWLGGEEIKTTGNKSSDYNRGPTELVQHFAYGGSLQGRC
jgi:hypothetical protein